MLLKANKLKRQCNAALNIFLNKLEKLNGILTI